MKKANLTKKVREAHQKDDYVPRTRPVRANIEERISHTSNGKLNLIGFYESQLLFIQNDRQWDDNLCRSYDRAMHGEFGRVFENYPLKDLTEQDYIALWQKYLDSNPQPTERQRAYTMIRYLADLAYRLKKSDVVFWGDFDEEIRLSTKVKNKDDLARKGEALGLRIGRSLSPQAEIRLLIAALKRIAEEGAFLAGIIIFLLGFRTSEACGLRFCDIIEVRPGYWAAKRYVLMEASGGELAIGAKTDNGYRYVPLPRFLATLILARRDALKEEYPHENVEEWTIACSGRNYKSVAKQDYVNRIMNDLYRETKCDEDLMRMAIRDFRTDQEIREECEKSLIVYLGRHQMITEMVAVGMPEKYIFALAGHSQMDPDADIADLSNPDVFVTVSDYLNRRPAIWALDNSVHVDDISFTGKEPISILVDGEIEINCRVEQEQKLVLALQAQDPMNEIIYEWGDDVSVVEEYTLPPYCFDTSKKISITPFLRRKASEIVGTLLGEEKDGRLKESSYPTPTASEPEDKVFRFAAVEIAPVDPETLPTEQAHVVRKRRSESSEEHESKDIMAVSGQNLLYALDETGTLVCFSDDLLRISNRSTLGKKASAGKSKFKNLYYYDPSAFNYALTSDGWIYPIPPQPRLDSILLRKENAKLADAFHSNAMLVALNGQAETQRLICVTNTGAVVSFEAEALRKIRSGGRKIVTIDQADEQIVSACFCQDKEDILIVSAKGQALRLAASNLATRKTLGTSPIVGLKLSDGDRAVCCLPYGKGDFLFAKEDGMIAAIHVDMMPHNRGAGGNTLILGSKVVSAINHCDLVAMLDDAGYFGIYSCAEFPARKGKTKGVGVKKVKHGNKLLAACGMPANNHATECDKA